jgi:predicted deacylase
MNGSRRAFLRAVGGVGVASALAGCGAGGGASADDENAGTPTATAGSNASATETGTGTSAGGDASTPTSTVERRLLLAGTEDETPLVRIDAPAAGPTVVLVGGLHGDEVAGWKAATAATDWEIDAGSLVVIPKATIRAVEARERDHPVWGNANRMFPLDATPRSPLGKALWDAVERADPEYLLDLHSSKGIYSESAYYGQHVFYTEGMTEETEAAIGYLNRAVVPEDRPAYEFTKAPMDVDYEMLARKASRELGAAAALFEVTEKGLAVETQVAWTTAYVKRTLDLLGVRKADGGG